MSRPSVFVLIYILTLANCAISQEKQSSKPFYDLLLKGGRVIDPRNDVDGRRDVAIRDDKIAAVAELIPDASADRVVDVTGLIITPGLVDIHVHCNEPGRTEWEGFETATKAAAVTSRTMPLASRITAWTRLLIEACPVISNRFR